MVTSPAIEALADAVEAGGLAPRGSSGVVLVSGGPDSAAAAAALAALCGPAEVAALHLNYGLREDSGEDERAARALCAKLRIDLHVERPSLPEGNVQARAREARYAAAERLRERLAADWVATGHTRTDVAETVLYRLATSPGARALLGLPARSGAVIRPLHSISREETRAVAEEAGLPFVDDPSNATPRFARNRIRAEVLPVLSELGPAAERNIAATHAELHEEAALLSDLVHEVLARADVGPDDVEVAAADLERMPPALSRLVLRELAERAADGATSVNRSQTSQILRLALEPEGGTAELPGGVRAVCEAGAVRFEAGERPLPEPARLAIPGRARFGEWELNAELREAPVVPGGPDLATLDAAALGPEVEVRAWREGDRMRPLGLGGSKSLQDLFTDRGVPRSERHRTPVVVGAGGRIAWVAGLAVGEDFRIGERSGAVAVLSARKPALAPSRHA